MSRLLYQSYIYLSNKIIWYYLVYTQLRFDLLLIISLFVVDILKKRIADATGDDDVPIIRNVDRVDRKVERLSKLSSVVAGLKPIKQKRVYVARRNKDKALKQIEELL